MKKTIPKNKRVKEDDDSEEIKRPMKSSPIKQTRKNPSDEGKNIKEKKLKKSETSSEEEEIKTTSKQLKKNEEKKPKSKQLKKSDTSSEEEIKPTIKSKLLKKSKQMKNSDTSSEDTQIKESEEFSPAGIEDLIVQDFNESDDVYEERKEITLNIYTTNNYKPLFCIMLGRCAMNKKLLDVTYDTEIENILGNYI